VLASSTDMGQGAITIFAQLAADALGLPPTAIVVPDPATDVVPDSGPTVASRTCDGGRRAGRARRDRAAQGPGRRVGRGPGVAGDFTARAPR
jgi:CO/xanthine dehydrogenase Mo-binding subunit